MISSTKNKEAARIRKLNSSASARRSEGVFVAEGIRFVKDIAASKPDLIEKIYYTNELSEVAADEIFSGAEKEETADFVMESMADTKTPQGILATVRIPQYEPDDIIGELSLILILDNIKDPGNMGTMFRSFEAAKGSGIVLLGECTDPFSPKCTRATMGSIVRMPHIFVKEAAGLSLLKAHGITIFSADLSGDEYDMLDFTAPCAFIIGNEARGISDEADRISDKRLHIPMGEGPESLNAAVTAAVLSFEAASQRRRGKVWI